MDYKYLKSIKSINIMKTIFPNLHWKFIECINKHRKLLKLIENNN